MGKMTTVDKLDQIEKMLVLSRQYSRLSALIKVGKEKYMTLDGREPEGQSLAANLKAALAKQEDLFAEWQNEWLNLDAETEAHVSTESHRIHEEEKAKVNESM